MRINRYMIILVVLYVEICSDGLIAKSLKNRDLRLLEEFIFLLLRNGSAGTGMHDSHLLLPAQLPIRPVYFPQADDILTNDTSNVEWPKVHIPI